MLKRTRGRRSQVAVGDRFEQRSGRRAVWVVTALREDHAGHPHVALALEGEPGAVMTLAHAALEDSTRFRKLPAGGAESEDVEITYDTQRHQ